MEPQVPFERMPTLGESVTQLLSGFTTCIELCYTIEKNGRLGASQGAFQELQLRLEHSAQEIQIVFDALRDYVGSLMELGDVEARNCLKESIYLMQFRVQRKLDGIASGRSDRTSHNPELPGFRDLRSLVETVEDNVTQDLEAQAQRLQDRLARARADILAEERARTG
ncbi:uncharacterized protein BP5553_05434 [Venustampulla echinocandica]|uniref:Fungal N-terminal domain-containing protein n=1 Tax=Venustampulla echinocandica TaxID=2656787 RepID=A0A370TR56_9HELO|nr:uncharacterized protein BP5553_05434 [Venustampulla echinocandica]RDL38001.1 hypothetical protein BP5553_05434 [Venustampulla echinocandica]